MQRQLRSSSSPIPTSRRPRRWPPASVAVEALSIDVTLAPGGEACGIGMIDISRWIHAIGWDPGWRLRLYLVDLPEGMSVRDPGDHGRGARGALRRSDRRDRTDHRLDRVPPPVSVTADASTDRTRREQLAEREGFEPPGLAAGRFQGGCDCPLCHRSAHRLMSRFAANARSVHGGVRVDCPRSGEVPERPNGAPC